MLLDFSLICPTTPLSQKNRYQKNHLKTYISWKASFTWFQLFSAYYLIFQWGCLPWRLSSILLNCSSAKADLLQKSWLRLTQPSLSGTAAELGNKTMVVAPLRVTYSRLIIIWVVDWRLIYTMEICVCIREISKNKKYIVFSLAFCTKRIMFFFVM